MHEKQQATRNLLFISAQVLSRYTASVTWILSIFASPLCCIMLVLQHLLASGDCPIPGQPQCMDPQPAGAAGSSLPASTVGCSKVCQGALRSTVAGHQPLGGDIFLVDQHVPAILQHPGGRCCQHHLPRVCVHSPLLVCPGAVWQGHVEG